MNQPTPHSKPIVAGERVHRIVRFTREQIAEFARLSGDANPLHFDHVAAQRARHGEIIASCQQTAAQLMGLAATYFSRSDDGCEREMLGLNFNMAFKAPVFAEQDLQLTWTVAEVVWSARLDGWVGHIDGTAQVAGRVCVVGRGTVLVKLIGGAGAA
ncbi:MAG TPA: MaoC family dehydratase [Rubrivivax sp.]